MSDKAQDKLVLNLTNEVRDLLQKYLATQSRETQTYAHLAIASFVLGCELACTEQKDVQAVIDSAVSLAREYSDTVIESA